MDNNTKISIFFAGDFCSKPSTSIITVDDKLKATIKECNISIVNFEVPLKPDNIELPKVYYERFFQNDDVPAFLKSLGFDFFSVANNHLFDWGEKGYIKTIQALNNTTFGAGTYDEAYKVKTIEIEGYKIGFLAICYAAQNGVFDDIYEREDLGCAYMYDLKVNHVIIDAKKELDYLFILPHAGVEYTDAPIPELIARYKDFIDYGADGIIATHPHCPQGWEIYKEKPIFYSLGNFFFNSKITPDYVAQKPHWYEGLCVKLILSNNKISFEIINTRNIKNREIVIDETVERENHNSYICKLINEKHEYNKFLKNMMSQKKNGLYIHSVTFMINGLIDYVKAGLRFLKCKINKKPTMNDYYIIFKDDAIKSLTKRILKELNK